jgi:hypothetical protein
MIFIVDNNEQYSDHRIFIVRADSRFLPWWEEVVLPFLQPKGYGAMPSIVLGSAVFYWRGKDVSITPDHLVDVLVPVYEDERPVYQKAVRPKIGSKVRSRDGRRTGIVDGVDIPSKRPMIRWDGTHYALPVNAGDLYWD